MSEATLKELAAEALRVQDASNLSGVSRSYAEMLPKLRFALSAANKPNDTDAIATHPITLLWIDKLVQLSGHSVSKSVDAYSECMKLAE